MKEDPLAYRIQESSDNHVLNYDSMILKNIHDAVIVTDLQGIVTYWNDGATSLFGWSAEEMIGRPYSSRFPRAIRPWFAREIARRAAGEDWDGEFEDYRKDGSRIWIDARVRLIRDRQGQPFGILGVSHDISDRKRAEAALAVHDQLRRDVLDSLSAHVAVLAPDGTIRAVNRAWRVFAAANAAPGTDYPRHSDIGVNYLQICLDSTGPDSEEAHAVYEGLSAVLARVVPRFDLEYPCHSPDEERWFQLSVTPLSVSEGGAVVAHTNITQRKQAELRLSQSEERLRLALAAAQMGVWELSLDSGAVAWSPEVYTIFRTPSFAGTREDLARLIHPDDLAGAIAAFDRAIAGQHVLAHEFRIIWPGGLVRWVANIGQIHTDRAGRPISMIGTAHDITDLKKAEQVLVGQNRVLEQIAAGEPLGEILAAIVFMVEAQIPDTLCSVLLLHDERLWLGAAPNLPRDYNAAIEGARTGPSAGSCGTAAYFGETVIVDDIATSPLWAAYRGLALPHSLRACWSTPILAGAAPAPDAQRRVLGTFALYRREVGWPETNIGTILARAAHLAGVAIERDEAQRKLRESEERFRLLVDGVRDYAIYLTDPAGTVITWNLGAERTYGYATAEAIGSPIGRFYTDADVADHLPVHDLTCAAVHGRYEVEGWRVRKDGTTFWASIVTTALRHEDDTLRGFAKVVRDQTIHRQLEEQLRQSQKMEAIGQLAGGVAHDFNNLLTVINGYCQILSQELPIDDANQELLSTILEAGEKAARLTGQLLAFSRKAMVEPQVLDLNQMVNEITRLLQRLIGEDIALLTCLSPAISPIRIDPGQLEQVIINLAVNARDAMPTGGRLTISTSEVTLEAQAHPEDLPPGAYVELTVADNGVGMNDAVKAHIFEPFFTTKLSGKGTGLGLATVYGIIRQAGGQIFVESAVGRGSSFRILLPVAYRERATSHSDRPASAIQGTETIIIAEDEDEVRRLARRTLEHHGYTVVEARSGPEALAVAEAYTGAIHLLITDVVMPGMGGRALAETIRLHRPMIGVLYISGYTDDAVIRHGVSIAADAFLQKPFTPLSLAQKVRQILDQVYP